MQTPKKTTMNLASCRHHAVPYIDNTKLVFAIWGLCCYNFLDFEACHPLSCVWRQPINFGTDFQWHFLPLRQRTKIVNPEIAKNVLCSTCLLAIRKLLGFIWIWWSVWIPRAFPLRLNAAFKRMGDNRPMSQAHLNTFNFLLWWKETQLVPKKTWWNGSEPPRLLGRSFSGQRFPSWQLRFLHQSSNDAQLKQTHACYEGNRWNGKNCLSNVHFEDPRRH